MNLSTVVTTLTLLYWGILFTLTHIPVTQVPQTGASDKMLHLIAYTILSFMVNSQLLVTRRWNRTSVLLAIVVLTLFAGFDELTQLLVGRSAEWKDWQADLIGILTGTTVCAILIFLFRRHPLLQALLKSSSREQSIK